MNPQPSGDETADRQPDEATSLAAPSCDEPLLPFADPSIDHAPIEMGADRAHAWAQGYAKAKADIRKALVEACSHGDMHYGTWDPARCPFPGCVIARRLDGLE